MGTGLWNTSTAAVLGIALVGGAVGTAAVVGKSARGRAETRVVGGARRAGAASTEPNPGQLVVLDKKGVAGALCPLKHTDVDVKIDGMIARVTVTQKFSGPPKSADNGAVEAIYAFPLPDDAAVDDMTLTIGANRVVKGLIKRREEAREIYEAAKVAGKTAALLDQERPNIFTQSVANLTPGQDVAVTISYTTLVKYDRGTYTFVHPMVVGPRYVGGASAGATDPGKITPPITPKGTRAGHDISVTVELEPGVAVTAVESRQHAVEVKKVGKFGARIKLQERDQIPNKDFVLKYAAAGNTIQEGVLTEATEDGGFFTLILAPPAAPARDMVTPKEMVFVIDQTGSQSGAPIQKAKETMAYCLKNLNPGDTFQLLGFNTDVFPCFEKPVPATPGNIQKALAFLAPLQAAGGTDILKAADYALAIPDDPNRLRMICYMTDGYVGNDREIIAHVRKNRGRARMFPFGVGSSVNRFLIEGMAREGRGVADFVDLNRDGAVVAKEFYDRVADPLLTDISVDWGGLPVADVLPRAIPDVFSASPIIIKGRYSRGASGTITIRGRLRGKPWTRVVAVDLPSKPDGENGAIATLWAREQIETLEGDKWAGETWHGMDPTETIIETALRHHLMSQYTSFVAVEQRVVNIGGKNRRVDVPVEMPEGVSYEGIFGQEREQLTRLNASMGRQLYAAKASTVQARGVVRAGAPMAGGFGGARGASGTSFGLSASAPSPALTQERARGERGKLDIADAVTFGESLKAMTPERRVATLREVKLDSALRKLVAKPTGKTILVEIWLGNPPADLAAQLRKAGVANAVSLIAKKMWIGEISESRLDALIALGFVRRVAAARE